VYQNEPELCNTELNATQEAMELERRKMCDAFGMMSAGKYRMALIFGSPK